MGYEGEGYISFVLKVMAGTNIALACGKGLYFSFSARLYDHDEDFSFRW